MAEYGRRDYFWGDSTITNLTTLIYGAQLRLRAYREPRLSYEATAFNLEPAAGGSSWLTAALGDRVKVYDEELGISTSLRVYKREWAPYEPEEPDRLTLASEREWFPDLSEKLAEELDPTEDAQDKKEPRVAGEDACPGEVLFDRILRENGIRHLLTAPRSPTTTGKVERFHKTLRRGALKGQSFSTLAEAQAAIDRWVERYNHRRPHQSLGQVPPVRRFCLAVPAVLETQPTPPAGHEKPTVPPGRTVTRTVGKNGRISLATHVYAVGTYLAGETVDVVLRDDRLLEIFHRGVLIAAHAQRQPKTTRVIPSHSPVKPKATARPSSVDAVLRMVDSTGQLSFAGTAYRVGKVFAGQQVEVRPTEDTVAIYLDGECLCTRPARHDPAKLHGAFAFPGGRPRKAKSG